MAVQARDEESYPILEEVEKYIAFIHKHRNFTNVFVHCNAGISRSPAVVIAYLINKMDWTLSKSFDFVKSFRAIIRPNDGFMTQLHEYEKSLQTSECKEEDTELENPTTTEKIRIGKSSFCRIGNRNDEQLQQQLRKEKNVEPKHY